MIKRLEELSKCWKENRWMQIADAARGTCILSAFLGTLLFANAQSASSVVAHCHFVGFDQVAFNPKLAKLKDIADLPATLNFKTALLQKYSAIFAQAIAQNNDENSAALFQPLLADVMENEAYANFGGRPGSPFGFVLAIRLSPTHSKTWEANLSHLFRLQPTKTTVAETPVLQWGSGAQSIRLINAKGWAIISRGDDLASVREAFIANLQRTGKPGAAFKESTILEADIDWVGLSNWVPQLVNFPLKLARTEIAIGEKAGNLQTTVKAHYPQPLKWQTKPWQIPTDVIHDPVVSFTSCQDLGALVSLKRPFSEVQPNLLHDQLFVWAEGYNPFQTTVYIKKAGANRLMQSYSTQLSTTFNSLLKENRAGEIKWLSEKKQISWEGLPMIVPYLKAADSKQGECLLAGLFPIPDTGKPVPPELFNQVAGRTNLLYYDWELTGVRLEQWRSMSQMLPMLSKPKSKRLAALNASAAGSKASVSHKAARTAREAWLLAVSPILGNTVTEITCTGPNDVMLVRKSHIGFTGLELVLLTHWLVN